MKDKIYTIDIDLLEYQNRRDIINIFFDESDISTAYIIANLKMQGEVYNLENSTAIVMFSKNDGNKGDINCIIENPEKGIIKIPFSRQSLITIGINKFQILISQNGKQLLSPHLYYHVTKSLINDEDIVSSNEFGVLNAILEDVKNLKIELSNLITDNEILNNTLNENESIRIRQEEERQASITSMKENIDNTISNTNQLINTKVEEINQSIENNNNITSENTNKINNKILEISQSVSDKFIEVDEKVNNKLNEADSKILECDNKMQEIEANFNELVNGTGFATQKYVNEQITGINKNLEEKANSIDIYTKEQIDEKLKKLTPNIPDLNSSNIIYNKNNQSNVDGALDYLFSKVENDRVTMINDINSIINEL